MEQSRLLTCLPPSRVLLWHMVLRDGYINVPTETTGEMFVISFTVFYYLMCCKQKQLAPPLLPIQSLIRTKPSRVFSQLVECNAELNRTRGHNEVGRISPSPCVHKRLQATYIPEQRRHEVASPRRCRTQRSQPLSYSRRQDRRMSPSVRSARIQWMMDANRMHKEAAW